MMETTEITLGQARPGDIIRLTPGHVANWEGTSAPWYSHEPHDFLILCIDHDEIGDTRHKIGCWPITYYKNDVGWTCGGAFALMFIDRQDVLCWRLGNILEMIQPGWGAIYSIPFDERREKTESEGE